MKTVLGVLTAAVLALATSGAARAESGGLGQAPRDHGRAVVTVVNDTDDQMIVHINGEEMGWLRPRQTRDFPLGPGKSVVSANTEDGDVYVHSYDNPVGFVVWYINEGH